MLVAEDLVEMGGRTAFRSISYALSKEVRLISAETTAAAAEREAIGTICRALLMALSLLLEI